MSKWQLEDHPVIANMERTGYPDEKEPDYPHCPICGAECDSVYINKDVEVIGCEGCVRTKNAWECSECFPKED